MEELRQAHKARVAVAWAALDTALQAFYDNTSRQKQVEFSDTTRLEVSQQEADRHRKRWQAVKRDHRKITMDTAITQLDGALDDFAMKPKFNAAGAFVKKVKRGKLESLTVSELESILNHAAKTASWAESQ